VSSGVYFKGPPTNAQPTLIPIPDMSIPEGSLSLPIIATAPELGQSLTFSLDPGAPAGVSIHPTTGVITGFWADQVGTLAPIIVNVYDNGTPPLPNRDKFILTVVNAAPTAAIIGPPDGLPGETLSFSLQATDPSPVDQAAGFTFQIDWDGDLIVDQTVVGPSGTVVTRSFASVGTHTIRVTATDKDNGTSSVFTLNQTIASWGLRPNGSLIDLLWYGTSGVDRMGFRDLGSGDVRIYSFADEEDVFYGTTLAIASGVTGTVRAFGGDGEDMIAMVQVAHAFIDGGDDDDMLGIFFSPTGSSTILGGQGNDQIFSFEGLGHDVFADGGSENDRILIMSGTGIRATLLGGTGDDFIAVATDTDVTIHAEGGLGDDYIGGGAGDDWIDGGDGDDILAGEVLSIYPGGNDTVMGGAGNDIIIGGAGADLLTGGVGQDFLIAGSLSNYLGDTPFDSIPIADIWRTADPIATRKGHLEGSIPSSLDPMFYLVAGVTVFDDTDVDQLLGGDDEDWFFYDAAEDTHDLLVGVDLETLF
jgi:Ca2+-binding RTX toxin-like protein